MFVFQIHEEAKKFAYQTGVRVVVAYGGAPVQQQVYTFLYSHFLFLEGDLRFILCFECLRVSVVIFDNSSVVLCMFSFSLIAACKCIHLFHIFFYVFSFFVFSIDVDS